MAKVKIILEKNETEEQVKEDLIKAFQIQSSGIMHTSDKFEDSAMNEIHKLVLEKYNNMVSKIMKDIDKLLKESIK